MLRLGTGMVLPIPDLAEILGGLVNSIARSTRASSPRNSPPKPLLSWRRHRAGIVFEHYAIPSRRDHVPATVNP